MGFIEDWVICPIDDCTDKYWSVDSDKVKYAVSLGEYQNEEGLYYEDDIYQQRFYNKHVYRGEKLTMIFCDPHTDGMKWFRIFDNNKEIK